MNTGEWRAEPAHRGKGSWRRSLGRAALVLLLLVVAGGGVRLARRPPLMPAELALSEEVVRVLAVTGRLHPVHTPRVAPPVLDRLVELYYDEGDSVSAGAIMGRLESTTVAAALSQAEAALAGRREELEQRRRDLDRLVSLAGAGDVAARELEAARSDLVAAEEEVRRHESAVVERQAQLERYLIRAPVSGLILRRLAVPGDLVGPDRPVFEIAAAGASVIEAEIDERFLLELRPGMSAVASVPSATGEALSLRATLERIGPVVDTTRATATVRFTLGDLPAQLPAHLTVDLLIEVSEPSTSLTIPRRALARGEGGIPYVVLLRGGETERREVRLVDWPADRIVITAGVEEGDTVALEPLSLPAGIMVRPALQSDAKTAARPRR